MEKKTTFAVKRRLQRSCVWACRHDDSASQSEWNTLAFVVVAVSYNGDGTHFVCSGSSETHPEPRVGCGLAGVYRLCWEASLSKSPLKDGFKRWAWSRRRSPRAGRKDGIKKLSTFLQMDSFTSHPRYSICPSIHTISVRSLQPIVQRFARDLFPVTSLVACILPGLLGIMFHVKVCFVWTRCVFSDSSKWQIWEMSSSLDEAGSFLCEWCKCSWCARSILKCL